MASDALLVERLSDLEARVGVLEAKERAAVEHRSSDFKDVLDTKRLLQESLDKCLAIKQECIEMMSSAEDPVEHVDVAGEMPTRGKRQTLAEAFAKPVPRAKAKRRGKGKLQKPRRVFFGTSPGAGEDDFTEEIELADLGCGDMSKIRTLKETILKTSTFMTAEQAMELAGDVNYTGQGIGNDLWENCILIGVEGVGRESSILLALGLLTALFARLFICYAIEMAMEDPLPPVNKAKQFREEFGHDPRYMAGDSLIRRVCDSDGSLHIATFWRDWNDEISRYLQPHGPTRVGPTLAMSISIIWVSISFEEMQSCVVFLAALWNIPRSADTLIEVQDGRSHLRSMPFRRFILMVTITLLRLATSIWIMGLGLRWILKTKSITGILHSAIDFCFVLDVGKVVAPSFSSILVNTIVSSLVPLSHVFYKNRPLGILLNCITLACGAFLIILSWSYYLAHDIDQMQKIMDELCGGNLDFHTSWQSATGYVLSASTVTQSNTFRQQNQRSRKMRATREIIRLKKRLLKKGELTAREVVHSRWYPNYGIFQRALMRPGNFVDDVISCEDTCSKKLCPMSSLSMLRRDAGKDDGNTCEDFKDRCWQLNANLLRRLCPATCGCDDKRSGLFLSGDFNGCPRSLCESGLRRSLRDLECRDHSAEELQHQPAWRNITKQIIEFYSAVLERPKNAIPSGKLFWEKGCEALDELPKERFCNPSHQLVGSMHAWCPVKCGCTKRPYDSLWVIVCPRSCRALHADKQIGM